MKLKAILYYNPYHENYTQEEICDAIIEIQSNSRLELVGIYQENVGYSELKKVVLEDDIGNFSHIIFLSLENLKENDILPLGLLQALENQGITYKFFKEDIDSLVWSSTVEEVSSTWKTGRALEKSLQIREGLARKQKMGEFRITPLLGYHITPNNTYEIVPEEAETVRLIFDLYLDGYGHRKIAALLEGKNIQTHRGNKHWSPSTIGAILTNERYMGDFRTRKTVSDPLTDLQTKNQSSQGQLYFENHHEAIIPREVFLKVQQKKGNHDFIPEETLEFSLL